MCDHCGEDGAAFLSSIGVRWGGIGDAARAQLRVALSGHLKYGMKVTEVIFDVELLALSARRDLWVETWTRAQQKEGQRAIARARQRASQLANRALAAATALEADARALEGRGPARDRALAGLLRARAQTARRGVSAPHPYDRGRGNPGSEALALFRANLVSMLGRYMKTGGPVAARLFEQLHAEITGVHVAGGRAVRRERSRRRLT